MANLYATPSEIKAAMPDTFQAATVKYDAVLAQIAEAVSRWIDKRCSRVFFPALATRYYAGNGLAQLDIHDLVSWSEVAYSLNSSSFVVLGANDVIGTDRMGDENSSKSFRSLVLPEWGTALAQWPAVGRGVRVTGTWGYTDDRDAAWEDTGITLASGITATATSITLSDADGLDVWGQVALPVGRLVRVDTEMMEITGWGQSNAITVVRARNGSSGAVHSTAAAVQRWGVPEPVRQAAIIQAGRQLARGLQGWGDSRATPDLGGMMYVKAIDPEVVQLLWPYEVVV